MRISDPVQKVVLHKLFYDVVGRTQDGEPVHEPKQFAIEQLLDAASAAKKLVQGSTQNGGFISYSDEEITFTPAEVTILKGLFDGVKEWGVGVADAVLQLQAIFQGKEGGEVTGA